MSILRMLLGRNKIQEQEWNPVPEEYRGMPVRPYLVLHAGLPFYSDPECTQEVGGAKIVVLRSEDPRQKHHPVEVMPTRKEYEAGQILRWDINHKRQWEDCWYLNPETGLKEKAWSRCVEFTGMKAVFENAPGGDPVAPSPSRPDPDAHA